MDTKTQQITSSLLALLSVAGLGGTVFLTAKKAPKISKKLDEAEKKKGGKLSFKEKLSNSAKDCIPIVIVGGATAISMVSSTIISRKTEASLGATAVALDGLYRRYRGKVSEIFGKDAQEKILSKFAEEDKPADVLNSREDGKKLYYCDYIGFFYAKPEKVEHAYSNVNLRMNASSFNGFIDDRKIGYYTFEDFVQDCEAEILDEPTYNKFKNFGWSLDYLLDFWEDSCVYLGQNEANDTDTPYTNLVFTADPIIDPKNYNPDLVTCDLKDPDLSGENK